MYVSYCFCECIHESISITPGGFAVLARAAMGPTTPTLGGFVGGGILGFSGVQGLPSCNDFIFGIFEFFNSEGEGGSSIIDPGVAIIHSFQP